jgi:DNA-binding Lrp family transcriptional regulator
MAMKARSGKAREQVEASEVHDDPSDRRHPLLNGLRKDIYDYIEAFPNSTRAQIADGLRMRSSTATARIKELIDEGYVFETGVRQRNKSGVMSKCLQVTDRPQGGKPNDKVRVEVTLTIDHNGVYGATAHVVGGKKQSGKAFKIKSQRVTLTAPHPEAYKSSKRAENENPTATVINRLELQSGNGDVIDADFYEVHE